MRKEDVNYISKIEKYSNTFEDPDFGNVVDLSCWKEKDFLNYIEVGEKLKNSLQTIFYAYVLENTIGQIIGYAICIEKKPKLTVVKFCVHKNYRRKYAGTFLFDYIVNNHDVKVFNFIVKEYEQSYIKFCLKKGLKSSLYRNFFGNGDDAIIFYKNVD